MPYKNLTEAGKLFIKKACDGTNNLIQGIKYYRGSKVGLPYSTAPDDGKLWVTNAIDQFGKKIVTNTQLNNALVYWFEKYSKLYDLDSNIIAAQAYQESKYNIWIFNYALSNGKQKSSTASGISQFLMSTAYDIMIRPNAYTSVPELTKEEKQKLTKNLTGDTKSQFSYLLSGAGTTVDTRNIAKYNRIPFHQNIIDNPDLCIKAQCRLMSYIASRNNNLASSSLFAYSRGAGLSSKTYSELIDKVKKSRKDGEIYIKEGLLYVQSIFGYLGDQENKIIKPNGQNLPKPANYWFGYKDLKLNETFNKFNATIKETQTSYES